MINVEKKFLIPDVEIVEFSNEDIILTSTTDEMDGGDPNDSPAH